MDQIHEKFVAISVTESPISGFSEITGALNQQSIFPRSISVVAIADRFVYTFGYNPEERGSVSFHAYAIGELGEAVEDGGNALTSEINGLADDSGDVICHSIFISRAGLSFVVFMSKA